jgi:hypothetical protein
MDVRGAAMTHWKQAAAGLEFGLVAFFGTINQASLKYIGPNQAISAQLAITMSRILGPQLTTTLFTAKYLNSLPGFTVAGLPPQGINLMGPLNNTTFAGAGLVIFDYFAKHYGIPYYSKYGIFVRALGGAFLVAGIFGGLLDPPGDTSTQGGGPFLSYNPVIPLTPGFPQQPAQTSVQPYRSVQGVRLHGR